jgi:hypothetical protein
MLPRVVESRPQHQMRTFGALPGRSRSAKHAGMSDDATSAEGVMPKGFRAKLFVAGVIYMFAMAGLSSVQNDERFTDIWFRSALPVTWLGASLLHWALARRRAKPRTVVRGWASLMRRHPGAAIWWLGMAALVMGIAATRGPTWSDADLRVYEFATGTIIVAAAFGSIALRRKGKA